MLFAKPITKESIENHSCEWYHLNMFKRLAIILYFLSLPAYAGVYEDAMAGDKNVLLYLYTDTCSMCKTYAPFFKKLSEEHKELNCIKVNAYTADGTKLMHKFRANYVPYVVLSNPKTKKHYVINPYCSIDEICIERAIKNFKS